LKDSSRSKNILIKRKTKNISIILILILILTIALLNSVYTTIHKDRKLPTLYSSKKELAIRGDIKSSDNFKLSTSKKIYKASIDTRFLDPNKKDLFVTLFSIYSGIKKEIILKKVNKSMKKKSAITLSYNINSRDAKNLKLLANKLQRLHVFIPIAGHSSSMIIGLDIIASGEKRIFPYKNSLLPVLGYLNKYESKLLKTKLKGIDGLEYKYNAYLNNSKNGILKGERDVLSNISFNKTSTIKQRKDGSTINLNISLKLQKNIEIILDIYKNKLEAKEILASVMDSRTGKVLALATSNRFNPEHIKQKEIDDGHLSVNATAYPFEPGSVIKPLIVALLLDRNKIKKGELVNAFNKGSKNKNGLYPCGTYKIGRWPINDEHQFTKKWLTLDDIIVHSSNIGILQLAQRLTGSEFYYGLRSFGLTKKTGIDLPFERKGSIHSISQYKISENSKHNKDNIYKATDSYGQGITTTFMQILKAYSVFNNNGKMVTPKLVNNIQDLNKKEFINSNKPIQIIKRSTAYKIKRLLIKTVQKGTGMGAKTKNIEVGGKTGTANMSEGTAGYSTTKYISSFFGFANGKKQKYTIGVTVREPASKGKYNYYASKSAVPVFKEIVTALVQLKYLKPKIKKK
jgi:cell division protein FtsI (penicillin-binding protein 3)